MYSLLWNKLQPALNLIQIWRKQGRKWVTTISNADKFLGDSVQICVGTLS